ncbi:MAG: PHP domain-containing protein [Fibrobacterota bacterium]
MSDGKRKKYIDLHIHSTYSDGTLTVKEIVAYASTRGLFAIALTDHDCVAGVKEMTTVAGSIGLEVVPGVEISSLSDNTDVHLLGYFVDVNNADLVRKLDEIRIIRIERARRIVERLNQGGMALRFERVLEFSKGFSIGRPHIAAALIAEEYVNNYSEAFDKYLGNHTSFYIPVQKLTPRDAIALIRQAGGLAVLAHPFVLDRDDIIDTLVNEGLDGVEVYYPKQPFNMLIHYREICHKYNLLETGGSDCHGPHFGEISLGSVKTPVGLLEKMKNRLSSRV